MRRGFTRYDEEFRTPASTEDDSCPSSELDLLNPRATRSHRRSRNPQTENNLPSLLRPPLKGSLRHSFASCGHVEKKPLPENKDARRSASLQYLPAQRRKYEPQVTFARGKSSSRDDDDSSDRSGRKLCRKGKTPRIIRAIRRNSRKFDPEEDRSGSPNRPQPVNSKSSVVVLYHEKSPIPESPFLKPSRRSAESDQPIGGESDQVLPEVAPLFIDRVKSEETLEASSPIYPIGRRRAAFRRRRPLSKRREPLNVHIYQDSRVVQVASSSHDRRTASVEVRGARPRSTRYLAESAKNLIKPRETSLIYGEGESDGLDRKLEKYCEHERTKNRRCRQSDNFVAKHMAGSSPGKDGDSEQRGNEASPENLMHSRPRERGDNRAFISVNDGDESKRVFPFRATPSGNLKIVPDQVVFESKKVSVLVADPRNTKLNVKAELTRPRSEVVRCASESSPRPGLVDLPAGVTSSAISQLEARKKIASNQAQKPRMQPYKACLGQTEMEHKRQSIHPSSHEIPTMNEVPLSSLGFTSEQPIDWDNIVLPEKTDLYQELARRITNYKNADCIVRIDQDEFHCHLLVLQSYSGFFDDRTCKETDLTGSGVSSKAFSIIYDWMISPPNESCHLLQRDNILEIFTAAQYLSIKELEEQCWAFIDNNELFTEDTAFLLYLEARKINNTAVMELMVPRIMKFFLMLVSTKDFLDLSVDELCLLLKSNYISVNSEMEVLMSAVRWLMHDWNNRKQFMLNVLKCVRFGLIAPWQLVDVKRNPENPEFIELMSFPEVQKMVDDGLAFVIIKYWYGNQTEDYYHWIDLLGMSEPTNRNWAGEDKNYVTYREFLLYLEEYQKTKVSELKDRKTQVKSGPLNSPLRNPVLAGRARNSCAQSRFHGDVPDQTGAGVRNSVGPGSKHLPAMPTEFMNEYLSSLERNHAKGNQGSSEARRAENTALRDSRFNGGGESPRIPYKSSTSEKQTREHRQDETISADVDKLDYESLRKKNAADVCRCQQWEPNLIFPTKKQQIKCKKPGDSDGQTDSAKSEEEAATTIQAVYRGYKTRRRFDEIRRSTSDEKRNVRKVADLLAIPVGETRRNEPARVSSSSAGLGRTEKDGKPNSPRKRRGDPCSFKNPNYVPSNPIRTIKSPAFFSNYDDRTNSLSPSDNTDTEDSLPPRSVPVDFHSNCGGGNNFTNDGGKDGDDAEGSNARSREIKVRSLNHNRPLPQKMSSSMLGPNGTSYFLHDSLFFPARESILVFGGGDPHEEHGRTGNIGKNVYRYQPDENVWEFVGEIPEARHHHSVAYLKGRVYIVGGADPREDKVQRKSIAVGNVWSYDPTTRTWFNEPALLTARKDFGLVVSQGKMYAIGGQGKNGTALRTVEAFDPSECAWREMQPMHTARIGLASVKYRDLIWVAGGMTKSKKELFSKDVECYDPIKNLWLKAVPLRSPRCFASFYVLSDCLYIIGGASTTGNGAGSIDAIDVWDAESCAWKEHAFMSIARHGHCTGSIGDQLLIIGGVTTVFMQTLNSVECYCCELCKWVKGVSALPHAISGHGTVCLPPADLLIDHR